MLKRRCLPGKEKDCGTVKGNIVQGAVSHRPDFQNVEYKMLNQVIQQGRSVKQSVNRGITVVGAYDGLLKE